MPRNCLRNYFSERKCFVFDRPANTKKMQCMDKLTDEDLEPCFVEQASNFCDYIFNYTKTKSIKGGYNVTGRSEYWAFPLTFSAVEKCSKEKLVRWSWNFWKRQKKFWFLFIKTRIFCTCPLLFEMWAFIQYKLIEFCS